jgi:hypothetical protein
MMVFSFFFYFFVFGFRFFGHLKAPLPAAVKDAGRHHL